ncbi:MAG TPA: RNA polymerase sigma factor [Halothiobacillus sp.]|nr:RNA polymerase sigma factor [Halothiobacillus sp.]
MGISSFLFGRLTFNNRLEQLRPRLYRLAFSWCKESFLAEDLVQEAMIRALQKQTQLREDALLDRWVIRILANLWMDHIRSHVRDENIDDVADALSVDENQSPDSIHGRDEMIERVRHAVMRLPEMQRIIVTLVDLEEFAYKEVATILDLPIGTIMSRLSRGRQALRNLLIDGAKAESQERIKTECRLRRVI